MSFPSSHLKVVCLSLVDGELWHELAIDPPAELYEGGLLPRDGGVAPGSSCWAQSHLQNKILFIKIYKIIIYSSSTVVIRFMNL